MSKSSTIPSRVRSATRAVKPRRKVARTPVTYHASPCTDAEWARYPDARIRYRRGEMSDAEIAALSVFCPGWNHTKRDHDWNISANEALSFYTDYGHHARQESSDKEESRIGWWLTTQRRAPNNVDGREIYLVSSERIAYLDKHYSVWRDTHLSADNWDQKFQEAVESVERDGVLSAESRKWVTKQRYRSRLSPEREARLDSHFPFWRGSVSHDE